MPRIAPTATTAPTSAPFSNTISQTITPAGTATAIVSATPGNPSNSSQVSFTVTVTPTIDNVVPTGHVVLTEGSTTLTTITLSNSGGVATGTSSPVTFADGKHVIIATYQGDNDYAFSDNHASPWNEIVDANPPQTLITGKPAGSQHGHPNLHLRGHRRRHAEQLHVQVQAGRRLCHGGHRQFRDAANPEPGPTHDHGVRQQPGRCRRPDGATYTWVVDTQTPVTTITSPEPAFTDLGGTGPANKGALTITFTGAESTFPNPPGPGTFPTSTSWTAVPSRRPPAAR